MSDRRDYLWNTVVPADLVLLAGLLAYFAYAIGADGPMVTAGHDDANRLAVDAWLQIPVHLAVAALLVAGAPNSRLVFRLLGGAILMLLWLFAVMSVIGVLLHLNDHYADLGDLAIASAILACYTIAGYLTYRGVPQRLAPPETASQDPGLRAMGE